VHEYKVYAIVIQMLDLDFMNNLWQTPSDNPWPMEQKHHNYKMCVLCPKKNLLGMNCAKKYALIEASQKRWLENANHPKDDKYELLI
jgi:hypothetical protein